MRAIEQLERVADASMPVLILGESGTGKELAARAIHQQSSRAKSAFVALNLAALPASLVEDELFGHVDGAFTGASASRSGRFRKADTGTLFLDEIGDIPLGVQVKLLRALEEGTVEPLGSEDSVHVDVRVVAATHRDLIALSKKGSFRADLLFRLSVISVELPPLRARTGDIGLLAKYFAAREIEKLTSCEVSDAAIERLNQYTWPGNVRELENAIMHARALATTNILDDADFNFLFEARPSFAREVASLAMRHGVGMAELERAMLEEALRLTNGNESEAARRLGLSRRSVDYRLTKKKDQ